MLAAIHTTITGWDVFFALLVVLIAFVLEKVAPTFPWMLAAALFGVALLVFVLTVST